MSFLVYQMVKQEPEDESTDRTGVMPQIVNVTSVAASIKDEPTNSDGLANVEGSIKEEPDEPTNPLGVMPQIINLASVAASLKEEPTNFHGGIPHIINMTNMANMDGSTNVVASVAASTKEELANPPGTIPQLLNIPTLATSSRDGSFSIPASMPQIINMSSVTAPSEPSGNRISSPANDSLPRANRSASESEPPAAPSAFASPAWYFFGVPGGSPNLQREVVVTCLLCQTEVRRGIKPGKLGTTCLYTHLERRHNLTREEICEIAASAGYCGPIAVPAVKTWKCSNDGNGLVLVPVKRSSASSSIESESGQPPKRHTTLAPAISGPSEPTDLTKKSSAAPAVPVGLPKSYDLRKRQVATIPAVSSGPSETPRLGKNCSTTASSFAQSEILSMTKNDSITATPTGPSETPSLVETCFTTATLGIKNGSITADSFEQYEPSDLSRGQISTALTTSFVPSESTSVSKCQAATVPTRSFASLNVDVQTSSLTQGQDINIFATSDLSRCQAMAAPFTSCSPPETPDFSSKSSKPGKRQCSSRRGRAMSTLYRQALCDRLLSSVHMYCEVCHTLILSGERSQSSRDLALEAHFSSKHPHMFNRLKRGAARDARLGGLGPMSKVPSDP